VRPFFYEFACTSRYKQRWHPVGHARHLKAVKETKMQNKISIR